MIKILDPYGTTYYMYKMWNYLKNHVDDEYLSQCFDYFLTVFHEFVVVHCGNNKPITLDELAKFNDDMKDYFKKAGHLK